MKLKTWMVVGVCGVCVAALSTATLLVLHLIEIRRANDRLQALAESSRQLSIEAESYEAWRYAAGWDSIRGKVSDKAPKHNEVLNERDYHLRAFTRKDVAYMGKSPKTGNGQYRVEFLLAIHDRLAEEVLFHVVGSKGASKANKEYAWSGEWNCLHVKCLADKMDAPTDWLVEDYAFSPVGCPIKAEQFHMLHEYGQKW